jgi:soluble cytochrome b562
MYWDGVKGDLETIVRSLRIWQQPKHNSVVVDDEEDDFIHGFDTFIDQVIQESRAFAIRCGMFGRPF